MKKITMIAMLALASCATHPDNIKPVETGAACTPEDRERLAEISEVQAATATNDAVGVFLIGLPLGSMAGKEDYEAEIARLKGACGPPAQPVK